MAADAVVGLVGVSLGAASNKLFVWGLCWEPVRDPLQLRDQVTVRAAVLLPHRNAASCALSCLMSQTFRHVNGVPAPALRLNTLARVTDGVGAPEHKKHHRSLMIAGPQGVDASAQLARSQ
jgi:hypothetical protein